MGGEQGEQEDLLESPEKYVLGFCGGVNNNILEEGTPRSGYKRVSHVPAY